MALMAQREFNFDKRKSFSEWYNSVIYAADLVDGRYNVQGFVVHRPWGTRIIRALYKLFEAELEADGHEPVVFPTVIPKENFEKESQHVEGFVPQVFWVTEAGGEKLSRPLALRPTSETAFYQMYSLWVRGTGDLPLKLYQSCSVFRFEHETLPFIRGREFLWIETHDAFATRGEAVEQVKRDNEIARKVLTGKLGIPLNIFERPQWDKFPGADATFAYDVLMPDGKVLQVGSTHLLGQNFAKAFGIKFTTPEGREEYCQQTCFGPGIWRMVAALASVHGDGKGLILPESAAPVHCVIIPIIKGDAGEQVAKHCENVKTGLEKAGLQVKIDASGKSPGFKYNEWELKGVPLRAEVGGREAEANSVTLVRRDDRSKQSVPLAKAAATAGEMLEAMLATLSENAVKELRAATKQARTLAEVEELLKHGGIVIAPFCSIGADGAECGAKLQEATQGGKVRGVPAFSRSEPHDGAKCVVCGKPAGEIVRVARQY
ncbi:MAG: proline--tRNA ligase [Candidatus Micrarchaeota archaeon]